MDVKKIIIGQVYLIKDTFGGCGTGSGRIKCKDCKYFKGKIRVTNFAKSYSDKKRCVGGQSLIKEDDTCSFDPRDLVPISWRARYDS